MPKENIGVIRGIFDPVHKGHTEELLELNNRHRGDVINVCGSDKVTREMEVYGTDGDTFGMVCRPEFDKYKEAHKKSLELKLILNK